MKNKRYVKILMLILIMILANCFIITNKVNAASYSTDIEGMNETKYPGYKDKLLELKKIYPNIKLFYTGLDWDTVIENERVHGRNLVPSEYGEEWRCSECGDKTYDTGWYCASEEAIEYLMDPRVYLNTTNIFQFQRLDTSSGTLNTNAIQIAAQNSFLYDWDNVVAIYNAAHDNNINAFHLVTRTIQEQGRAGTSILSSGKKYIGTDGVTYEGLYNLFSIGATGSTSAEVATNGLARAKQENWTSRPLSIAGGGTFIKSKYLNRNQNTLYLQKFDVDGSFDGLYWHQYMQNLFAAKNEALLMYDAYNATKLTLSKEFEFIIPVYENMSKEISKEPSKKYYGEINTDLTTMNLEKNSSGNYMISGNILIAEWINGVAEVPKDLPEMTLKSTDGTYSAGMYVRHEDGLNYYYDRVIDNLDMNKEYYIEVTLTTDSNLSDKKTQKANMHDMTVGTYNRRKIKIVDNKLIFSEGEYIGEINTDLKTIELNKKDESTYYVSGNILIAEWINGVANTPKGLPELTLKSTDNKVQIPMYVGYLEGISYYYDVFLDNVDLTKQYYIEAKLTSSDNISDKKTQTVKLPNKELGEYEGRTIKLEDNKIKFTYNGEINTDLKTMSIIEKNGKHYIEGDILIAEWIEGTAYEPQGLPEMMLKATDDSYTQKIELEHQEGLDYKYSVEVENLNPLKEYEIETKLTGENNIGSKKNQIAKLVEKEVGKYGTVRIYTEDNKIKIEDSSLYNGEINTDLTTIKLGKNEAGLSYIYGNIIIAEWINGVAYEPQGLPKMTLKSIDGTYSAGMYVNNEGGMNYYYDRVIENIDTSKEYYIEVELTGEKNIGNKKTQKANIRAQSEIGEYRGKKIVVENNNIKFQGNEYNGEINTDLTAIKLGKNEAGLSYIYGNIIIAEWINGVAYKPQGLPKMTLKSIDGTYSAGMYVNNEGGMNYYYDRVIENIDTSKEYYIEVELTGEKNIGNKKTQKANIRAQSEIGEYREKKIVVENNNIKFQGNEYNGEINTDLTEIKIELNEAGKEYIKGNIIIAEWINGVAYEPQGLPEMTLKSTDGEYSAGMYVRHEGGMSYYYDRVIYNLDTSKEYYIEVKLTGENNIGNKKVQKANIREQEEIGKLNNCEMKIINNNIVFEKETREIEIKAIEMQEEVKEEKQEEVIDKEGQEINATEEKEQEVVEETKQEIEIESTETDIITNNEANQYIEEQDIS